MPFSSNSAQLCIDIQPDLVIFFIEIKQINYGVTALRKRRIRCLACTPIDMMAIQAQSFLPAPILQKEVTQYGTHHIDDWGKQNRQLKICRMALP
ncbi:hypothetical protein ABH907_003761 [Pseudomonas frederiksbergensis]|uniref:hypothetical protein n=1 Tax=Pseudomonas frederiksbergensis TaxID=104087 RepID=UPI003D1B8718